MARRSEREIAKAIRWAKSPSWTRIPGPRGVAEQSANERGLARVSALVSVVVFCLAAAAVTWGIPTVGTWLKWYRARTARAEIAQFEGALHRYYFSYGHYPATDEGLEATTRPLVGPGRIYRKPEYLEPINPPDPWGIPYVYRSDGRSYVLKSVGGGICVSRAAGGDARAHQNAGCND